MRLQSLRVAELRQFREPFELAGIAPGLNIYTGANEAGKSTLVRAIRAAFFERHRSTSVDDLRPHGDSAAAPLVELAFELGGESCRLSKSFLHKKRCELMVGTRRLEGVEAEDWLAEQLGFQFAGKGASRAEHWGIPGLLWIEQGAGQAVRDAVGFAADHLRRALDNSLGEVAASGGDEITAQVQGLREELLTGTGKPRGAYQKAIADELALAAQLAALQQAVADYRGQVDQLRLLRQAHAADTRDAPWAALRQQEAGARQALQAAQALAGTRDREREQLRQTSGLRELLAQRLLAAEQQQQQLLARGQALAEASHQHEQAQAVAAQSEQAEAAAATTLRAARQALALARQEDNRATLQRQLADAQARAAELAELLQRASTESERAAALRREAVRLGLAEADLKALRQQQQRLTALEIGQAAVATRLGFDLAEGARIQLQGGEINGRGERLLIEPCTVFIAGVGTLTIAPGGRDLAELAQEQARLRGEHQALLQRLGLDSAAAADARERSHAARLADAEGAEKAARVLAPQGLETLRAALDAAQARQAEAGSALARLPAPPEPTTGPVPALDAAQRAFEAATAQADAALQALQKARQTLATQASRREAAQQERDALQLALDSPQLLAELATQRLALVEAGVQEAAQRAAVEALEAQIAAARPDILNQDVARLRRSADEAERQHQARDRQIVQLEAALAAAGAQGLEEELARCQGEQAQAARRLAELRRRAEALDYLLQRLEQRRQDLTRRLQAPLQKHLEHYLGLLLPAARLEVDQDLVPGALSRSGPRGPRSDPFEALSFGAREQMGVISRLAYADLLKEAGRPTLVILDDALVHSDEERLSLMKRALFDAAQRHQVLLFTCHPALWRDMGVPLQALEALRG
ncbi:AAA_23 domain-containing protein [Rubrivivax sp. A210]|uniref:AAA family ATPase n=1 Tax=Rubrivivax sp. A210 TaxID=2772301 RepID=UPI0019196F0C|nr:AAA family ATPase [Rubrivivax sp. A210]CAD5371687.1 AAA_23 domain-containing protein [Rubrivivax sp. A210]